MFGVESEQSVFKKRCTVEHFINIMHIMSTLIIPVKNQ